MKSLSEIVKEILREQEKKKKVEIGDEEESGREKANLKRIWTRVWNGRQ